MSKDPQDVTHYEVRQVTMCQTKPHENIVCKTTLPFFALIVTFFQICAKIVLKSSVFDGNALRDRFTVCFWAKIVLYMLKMYLCSKHLPV